MIIIAAAIITIASANYKQLVHNVSSTFHNTTCVVKTGHKCVKK